MLCHCEAHIKLRNGILDCRKVNQESIRKMPPKTIMDFIKETVKKECIYGLETQWGYRFESIIIILSENHGKFSRHFLTWNLTENFKEQNSLSVQNDTVLLLAVYIIMEYYTYRNYLYINQILSVLETENIEFAAVKEKVTNQLSDCELEKGLRYIWIVIIDYYFKKRGEIWFKRTWQKRVFYTYLLHSILKKCTNIAIKQ